MGSGASVDYKVNGMTAVYVDQVGSFCDLTEVQAIVANFTMGKCRPVSPIPVITMSRTSSSMRCRIMRTVGKIKFIPINIKYKIQTSLNC